MMMLHNQDCLDTLGRKLGCRCSVCCSYTVSEFCSNNSIGQRAKVQHSRPNQNAFDYITDDYDGLKFGLRARRWRCTGASFAARWHLVIASGGAAAADGGSKASTTAVPENLMAFDTVHSAKATAKHRKRANLRLKQCHECVRVGGGKHICDSSAALPQHP